MGVVVMGVVVTGCPKKNPYDSQLPKSPPKTYHWFAANLSIYFHFHEALLIATGLSTAGHKPSVSLIVPSPGYYLLSLRDHSEHLFS